MKAANDYSGYGNEILYKMCAKKPMHNDVDVIASKIWIIGRAYAAAIERKVEIKEGVDFCRQIVAPKIISAGIDNWIKKVAKIKKLTKDNLHLSLECHKKLTDLFASVTKLEKRSLASKYLHFHAPRAFFIYDQIANRKIRLILSEKQRRFKHLPGFDDQYARFATRCIYYRDEILEKELKASASPRRIDMSLLKYGF